MLSVHRCPGATVVEVPTVPFTGEERLRAQLLALVQEREKLVLDCSEVPVFSAAFLGLLLSVRRQAGLRKAEMVLCELSPFAQEVLEVARLDEFWPIYPTVEDALAGEAEPVIVEGAAFASVGSAS